MWDAPLKDFFSLCNPFLLGYLIFFYIIRSIVLPVVGRRCRFFVYTIYVFMSRLILADERTEACGVAPRWVQKKKEIFRVGLDRLYLQELSAGQYSGRTWT